MVYMKAWKRYIFYIISIQLFVFSLLSMKQYFYVNEEFVEEKLSYSPPHIASVGQKGTKNIRVNSVADNPKDWDNDKTQALANDKGNERSPDHTESLVKQLLLKMFEMEFFHGINVYQLTKSTIRLAEMFERDKVFNQIDVSLGRKEKHSYRLGDPIPASEAKNILIITRGRSGSTFTGNLLSRYPGTFYSYEPLHFGIKKFGWNDWNKVDQKIDLLKQIFKCEPSKEFVANAKKWKSHLNGNFRFKNACNATKTLEKSQACYSSQVYQSACSLFPIRLIKTIRIPFEDAESILLDPEIGSTLKIVFLFRDPRGRLQSIKSKVHWCNSKNETVNLCNVNNLCGDLTSDSIAATSLKEKYPDRVHLIRYEDVCLNSSKSADELQEFLDLEKSPFLEKFAKGQAHTSQAFKWKDNIADDDILEVQNLCSEPMKTLGYLPMTSIKWNKKDNNYKLMGQPSSQFQLS